MKRVLAIILGGGKGSRLYPLTKMRAKPAVPLAGKYRLIDIPISNCINSGIEKMYVLTQFNSASLNRHIGRTYNLNGPFGQGFVEVLAAQQTPDSPKWFEGTADAVRKYQWLFQEWDVDEYLILSGDQLYRMDYSLFVQHHRDNGADLTVAALPVDEAQAEDGIRDYYASRGLGDVYKRQPILEITIGIFLQHQQYLQTTSDYQESVVQLKPPQILGRKGHLSYRFFPVSYTHLTLPTT